MEVMARPNSPKSIETAKTLDIDNFDITENLPTLKIETNLPENKLVYLKLRARSHMLQSCICAQISFFVHALNEARRLRQDFGSDGRVGRKKTLGEGGEDQLKIGMIGCGHLGLKIAHCLLSYGGCKPTDLTISTRRPDTLTELKERGVTCLNDNQYLVKHSNLVFLTVLPAQLPNVLDEIKGEITPETIIYNLIPAEPLPRLKQVLEHNQIISPIYYWPERTEQNRWDYCQEIEEVYSKPSMVELTCPTSMTSSEAVVQTDKKWVELIMYALVNHCAQMGLNSFQVTQVVNRVLLGIADSNPGLMILEADDFTRQPLEPDDPMPSFDLTAVAMSETPLTRKVDSEKVQIAFSENYVNVFQQYHLKLKFDPLHRSS